MAIEAKGMPLPVKKQLLVALSRPAVMSFSEED